MNDQTQSYEFHDEISRAVIIDMFIAKHGLVVTKEQHRAMMELIKASAEWGRDHHTDLYRPSKYTRINEFTWTNDHTQDIETVLKNSPIVLLGFRKRKSKQKIITQIFVAEAHYKVTYNVKDDCIEKVERIA